MLDEYLFNHVGKAKTYIRNSVFLMMFRVFGTALIAFAFGILIENFYNKENINAIKIIILFVTGLLIRTRSLFKVTSYQSNIIGEVKSKLRNKLITKAMNVGANYNENISTSNLINLSSDTIEQLQNYYGRFLPEYYGCFGSSLVNFLIFLFIDWHVAILFFVLMPIIPLFLKTLLKIVTLMQKKYWKKYQDVGALF